MRTPILLLAAAAVTTAAAHAQVFCRPVPYFNPNGSSVSPYSNVAAAACATPTGSTLTLTGGTYYEQGLFSDPALITAASGPALIGVRGTESTTLRVLSFNTHLFGSFPLPVWQDQDRAIALGVYLSQQRTAGLDLVCLQETWAPARWNDIALLSIYPAFIMGDRVDSGNTQNSGLGLLTSAQLVGASQVSYNDARGNDASASKGYLVSHIVKDGFHIGVFNTHTQSGESSDDASTRALQLQQLAAGIAAYRGLFPSHPILIMGDFNVSDVTAEYTINMTNTMGGQAGTAETALNLACLGHGTHCTSCSDNTLQQMFGNNPSKRIDYILYTGSADGHVTIVPKAYAVVRPLSPALISGDGWDPVTFSSFTLSSHFLSDHEAITADFDIVRH